MYGRIVKRKNKVGLGKGRGRVHQIFALRQIAEKVIEIKEVYAPLLISEKAYAKVNRIELWKVLTLNVVHGRLLNTTMNF